MGINCHVKAPRVSDRNSPVVHNMHRGTQKCTGLVSCWESPGRLGLGMSIGRVSSLFSELFPGRICTIFEAVRSLFPCPAFLAELSHSQSPVFSGPLPVNAWKIQDIVV